MTRVEKLVARLKITYSGEPWHGPALRTLLDDIGEAKSAAHPVGGAHSIAEVLAHITAWNEIVGRRVAGEELEVTEEMNFPDVSKVKWPDLVKRLDSAHARLVEVVSRLRDDDLSRNVPGKGHSISAELHGLIDHNTYHSGQIAILKKA
jgi:uncharacterized damage-inducible protein DinB